MTWRDNLGFAYRGVLYSTTTPVRSVGSVGKEDIDYVNGRYDDGLVLTDRIVGELFDYIKKTGLADRTVVILQSEHGETLGERGYIAHYDIYDETVHTPLIIKMPALAGRRIETLTSGVDVLPTVLSLLRIPAPVVDGVDLSPFFTGATSTQPRREVYLSRTPLWERLFSSTFQGRAIFLPSSMPIESTAWAQFVTADNKEHYYDTAIRTEKWKLIHRLARTALLKYSWWGWLTGKPVVLPEYELYDLANDPGETRNIYSAHAHDADIVALRAKLEDWEVKMRGATPGPTPVQEIQPYF